MSPKERVSPRKFTVMEKLAWSMAAFGSNTISTIYMTILMPFYQDYLALPSFWIGQVSWIYAIWNAINDPLFGFISDSTRSKHGRRIPYMRYTAPLLGITFVLVWLVPPQWSDFQIFLWMLITMLLYDTCYTIIGLVYSALLPEITEDDRERNDLQKYSSAAGLLGLVFGFIISDAFRPSGGLIPFYIAMAVIAFISTVAIIITTFKIKERPEFTVVDEPLGFIESIKYTFKSKSFLILTSQNFMAILTQSLILSGILYVATYILKIASIIPLLLIIIGLLVGIFITNTVAKKKGVVQTQQLLLVVSGLGLCMMILVPDILIYPILFIAGIGLSGPLVLTNVLFAEVADEDEVKTGVRREAAFFGVNALLTKPAQSLAMWLLAVLLEMGNFVTQKQNNGVPYLNQPPSAILAIKLVVGPIPGISLIIGALILIWFPLKGDYLKKIQDEILRMHTEKHAKLLEKLEKERK